MRSLRIGLLDHMGYGNLGDAAIQEAVIASIRQRLPNAVIIGFSSKPEDTEERHNILTYPISWGHPGPGAATASPHEAGARLKSRLISTIKTCPLVYRAAKPIHDFFQEVVHSMLSYRIVKSLDLLIISGGGQICELWGGPWGAPYNVFKFCALAKLANTPLFILNVGAWPLRRRLSKFFAKWSVRLSSYSSFRDAESQALLDSLKAGKETYVHPDAAYGIHFQENKAVEQPRKRQLTVGLNPMGYCDPRIWPREDGSAYRCYLDKLTAFSLWLLAQDFGLAMFTSDISVDRYAIDDLRKLIAVDAAPAFTPCAGVEELLCRMSGFDFVITSKFHGVIFSHLLAKPVIALSYHPKIGNLMQTVGHGQYCLDIEHFSLKELKDTFSAMMDNRQELEALFRRTAESYAEELRQQFDELFLMQPLAMNRSRLES